MNNRIEITSVEINDIVQTSGDGIQVMVTATGKPLWLPEKHVDFQPGRAIIPVWLAKKIWRNHDKLRED